MENFTAYNPTRLHFGKDCTNTIGRIVKNYGKKALLLYGKGSVKKYGYYDKVVPVIRNAGVEIIEYEGIKPNPVVEDVERAAKIGRDAGIEVIVALGGGSVIDSAKIIALCIATGSPAWEFMSKKRIPRKSIPIIAVLTLAATGTEMNGAAVIQNHQTGEKIGFVNELNFPKHSFLDPQFTTTVPADYTAYGVVDLIAHALEAYFGKGEASVTDRIVFSIIKDAMYWAPLLMDDLTNYDLRANIMLDATLALNGLTYYGKKGGDWGVHAIGHQLSFLYDTPHGATLSIAYPAWLKLHKKRVPERIRKLGLGLFDTDDLDETIEKLSQFFARIKSPVHLSDIHLGNGVKSEILGQMALNKVTGLHHELTEADHVELVNKMM